METKKIELTADQIARAKNACKAMAANYNENRATAREGGDARAARWYADEGEAYEELFMIFDLLQQAH